MGTTFKYCVIKRKDITVQPDKNGNYPIKEVIVKYNASIPSTHRMLK